MRRTIVVVGASLAGLRAAEALRAGGFDERIVMVGDEVHRPYERPPLSKQVLAGARDPASADVVVFAAGGIDGLDLDWELGQRATGLALGDRTVTLADGRTIAFDGLVLATGAAPRRVPGWRDLGGVHELRTLDDAVALRDALAAGPGRLVVIGAGFIGAEAAATARGLGVAVTVVEPLAAPMVRGLGEAMGGLMAEIHRDHGVDLRLGVGVEALDADGTGRVAAVRLTDGRVVEADVVLVGIGVAPATGWLEGSGLTLDDGVVGDATCLVAPRVVAAGDVARWPNARYGDELMRVEHWDNAVAQGAHAARTLLADLAGGRGEPYAPLPWFWSDQYDRKLQLAGRSGPGDDVAVVTGSVADRRFTALYGRAGRLVGVLAMNMAAKVARLRPLLEAGTAWDDAVEIE